MASTSSAVNSRGALGLRLDVDVFHVGLHVHLCLRSIIVAADVAGCSFERLPRSAAAAAGCRPAATAGGAGATTTSRRDAAGRLGALGRRRRTPAPGDAGRAPPTAVAAASPRGLRLAAARAALARPAAPAVGRLLPRDRLHPGPDPGLGPPDAEQAARAARRSPRTRARRRRRRAGRAPAPWRRRACAPMTSIQSIAQRFRLLAAGARAHALALAVAVRAVAVRAAGPASARGPSRLRRLSALPLPSRRALAVGLVGVLRRSRRRWPSA